MHTRVALTLVTMTLVMLLSSVASANSFDLYGFGARGSAMGGAMSASASGYESVYYNMAAMAAGPTTFGFGLMAVGDDVAIKLKRRPLGYDLPDRGRNSRRVPTSQLLNARSDNGDLRNTYGFFAGLNTSLGIERFRIGFAAYLPLNRIGVQDTHFVDEREQLFSNQLHFELLGDRSQSQLIVLGAAYQLLDRLYVGAGFTFLPKVEGGASVYIDNATEQSEAETALSQDQIGRYSPQIGVLAEPWDDLKLAFVYRGELYFSIEQENEIQVRGYQGTDSYPTTQELLTVLNYSPHHFVAGAAWQRESTLFSVDLTHQLWSRFRNQQGEEADFNDTTSVRVGLEHPYRGARLRAGFHWEPTPVPDQNGRTNYVDNDRVGVSVGAGHPFELFGTELIASWFVQWQHLLPRDTNKAPNTDYPECTPGETELCDELPDDLSDPTTGAPVPEYSGLQSGNPGFPGYVSYGELLAVGADLRWTF